MLRLLSLTIILFAAHVAAASELVVLSSPGVHKPVKADRIRAIIREAAADLHVPEASLPTFVVLLITRKDADAQHWPTSTRSAVGRVAQIYGVDGRDAQLETPLYDLWIVDDPAAPNAAVVVSVVTAINQENKMGLSLDNVVAVSTRVCRRLNASIRVTSLR